MSAGLMFPKPAPRERKPAKRLEAKTPLERATPLERKTRINPKRETPRRGPWRSEEYKARVRKLTCCAPNAPRGCRGRMTASHLDQGLKEKGMGMKTGDQNCVPHCLEHNLCWDGHRGPFAGWTDAERERYADEAVHETQVVLGLREAV